MAHPTTTNAHTVKIYLWLIMIRLCEPISFILTIMSQTTIADVILEVNDNSFPESISDKLI